MAFGSLLLSLTTLTPGQGGKDSKQAVRYTIYLLTNDSNVVNWIGNKWYLFSALMKASDYGPGVIVTY